MIFVYVHAVIYGVWILANLGWLGMAPWDPSMVGLAMIASIEAIFLSTFVLITQNRMSAKADRRAELDLQISLLTEHEVTKIVQLLNRIAERTGVEIDGQARAAERRVEPADVLTASTGWRTASSDSLENCSAAGHFAA